MQMRSRRRDWFWKHTYICSEESYHALHYAIANGGEMSLWTVRELQVPDCSCRQIRGQQLKRVKQAKVTFIHTYIYIYIIAHVGGQYRGIFSSRLAVLPDCRANTEAKNRIFCTAQPKECNDICIIWPSALASSIDGPVNGCTDCLLSRVSLITGLLITGLDWTGILKFVFTLRGMQLKVITSGYDWLAHSLALHSLHA